MLSIRSKKIFVFGAWQGNKFADNSMYLYLEALKHDDIKAVWITKDKKIERKLRSEGYIAYYYNSLKGIYYQLRAGVYYTCVSRFDVFSLLMGNAININLCHGVPLKKMMYDDNVTNKTNSKANHIKSSLIESIYSFPNRKEYVVSTSDTLTDIYLSAYRKKRSEILQFGQPRNDVFFNDNLEIQEFPFREKDKKVILYMPTHRNEGKNKMDMTTILDFEELNKYCIEKNFLFLIKKHYYHRNENENLDNYSNIIDITKTDYDSQLLLKYSDLLITDYSSCYIDYLLLKRPIVFYYFDYDNYLVNDREMYFEYDKVTPGPKVKTFKELYMILQQITDVDIYEDQRKKVTDLFYSKDNQKSVGSNLLNYIKNHF